MTRLRGATISISSPARSPRRALSKAFKANRHIYDYVFTDSKNERDFVGELDASAEVVVYAKLPGGFFIPTPVGNYNPDWAIAFQEGKVNTSISLPRLKVPCRRWTFVRSRKARSNVREEFFAKITSDEVKYDVVDGYDKLMELVS